MTRAHSGLRIVGPTPAQFVAETKGTGSDHFLGSYWLGPAVDRRHTATCPLARVWGRNSWTRELLGSGVGPAEIRGTLKLARQQFVADVKERLRLYWPLDLRMDG